MKRNVCLSVLNVSLMLIIMPIAQLTAAQSNFQLSPPPVPWFEFDRGDKDLKVGATAIYLKGENQEGISGDIEVYGGGINGFYRYAFRDIFAIDFGGAIVTAYGDVGNDATMTLWLLSIPVDLEFQAIRNDKFVLILFGGFNFTWNYIGIDYDDGTTTAELDIRTNMRGPQGGAQLSFKLNDFVLTPFIMFMKLSGTASIDYSDNTPTSYSDDVTTTSPTATLYGIDVIYQPWNITLSSLVQQVSSSGDNKGFTTYIFSLNYCFHWPAVNSETIGAEEAQ